MMLVVSCLYHLQRRTPSIFVRLAIYVWVKFCLHVAMFLNECYKINKVWCIMKWTHHGVLNVRDGDREGERDCTVTQMGNFGSEIPKRSESRVPRVPKLLEGRGGPDLLLALHTEAFLCCPERTESSRNCCRLSIVRPFSTACKFHFHLVT